MIRTKDQVTYLFDTKTEGSDPANAHLKHNALIEFVESRNLKGLKTVGGIIIGRRTGIITTWQYCSNKINNTKELKGLDYFNPANN